jgi:hypothetical protein
MVHCFTPETMLQEHGVCIVLSLEQLCSFLILYRMDRFLFVKYFKIIFLYYIE